MDIIIQKINELIAQKGMLKNVLAKKIGLTKQSLYNILNGTTAISIENLKKIALALDVTVNYFFEENNQNSNIQQTVNGDHNTLNVSLTEYQHKNELLKKENEGLKKELVSKEKIISLLENLLEQSQNIHNKEK